MKQHWAVNSLTYILGLLFNAFLLLITGYLIRTYAFQGYAMGEDFAAQLTTTGPDEEVTFVLDRDTPREEAARMLEEAGLIPNAFYYQLELMIKDSSTSYKAGTYTLNKNMNTQDINITLRAPSNEAQAELADHMIIIPEGWGVQEIADYLESLDLMTAAEFVDAARDHNYAYAFLNGLPENGERRFRLEGYLFPDTYYISADPSPDEVIHKMLTRFDEIYDYEMEQRTAELGLTVDEVVTRASIIEREVVVAEERAVVAQVINNRLEAGMNLEIDATVIYAHNKHMDRLLYEDLDIVSPYNTYRNGGLPIGPICNPGAESLRAVLYPDDNDYLYYVLENEETGEHFFTDDYGEFLAARG